DLSRGGFPLPWGAGPPSSLPIWDLDLLGDAVSDHDRIPFMSSDRHAYVTTARARVASPQSQSLRQLFAAHGGKASGVGGSGWDALDGNPGTHALALDLVLADLEGRLSHRALDDDLAQTGLV